MKIFEANETRHSSSKRACMRKNRFIVYFCKWKNVFQVEEKSQNFASIQVQLANKSSSQCNNYTLTNEWKLLKIGVWLEICFQKILRKNKFILK